MEGNATSLKRKKQKPVEWDEYTETNLDRALMIIKKAKGNLQGYQSDDGIYECDKAIECIEHILYRGINIESIEDSVKFEEGFKTGRESGLRDGQKYVLDNAESYGLCKPVEWSEEDETRMANIIIMLEEYLVHHYSKDDIDKSVAWLKSLRPSWKPSVWQMSMLWAVIIEPNNAGSESCHRALRDIYEQLKKL